VIDLSVIIVNWNTRELLDACLQSVINGVHQYTTEVFVVDNGSSDGSQAMVRVKFSSVCLIENNSNHGFARANNQAIRLASGRYFLLLNSDTIIPDHALDELVASMDKNPQIGMAGLQLLNQDGTLQNSIARTPTLLTELTNKSLLRWLFPTRFPGKEFRPDSPIEVESVIGACLIARAVTVRDIGLLDENYFFFLEETDWCLRARRGGWKVVFFPHIAIYHLQGRSAVKVPVAARIEYWRSRYLFFQKHYSPVVFSLLSAGLGVKIFFELHVSLISSLFSKKGRERFMLYFNILLWHIKGMPESWGLQGLNKEQL